MCVCVCSSADELISSTCGSSAPLFNGLASEAMSIRTQVFHKQFFPSSIFKKISIHMKTQAHAIKHCQEHTKPTGGDIISTLKPCWPIRSLRKFTLGGDNSAGSDVTSQNLRFCCLHDNTATRVFEILQPGRSFKKMFSFSDLLLRLRVDERPNRIEKAVVLKITMFAWTRPHSVLSDRWYLCGVLSWKRSSSFWPCFLLLLWAVFPKSIVNLS